MLDHEPDTNNDNLTAQAPAADGPATAAPPRRRRAATRKAGPPAASGDSSAGAAPEQTSSHAARGDQTSSDAVQVEQAPAREQASEPGQAAPAKKAARKRTAKTAEGGRPARKRASKKAAAAPPADEQPAAVEPAAEQPVVAAQPTSPEQPGAAEQRVAEGEPQDESDATPPTAAAVETESPAANEPGSQATAPAETTEPSADAEAALDEIRMALSAELPPGSPAEESATDESTATVPELPSDDAPSGDAPSDDAPSDDAPSDDAPSVDAPADESDDTDESRSDADESDADESDTEDSDSDESEDDDTDESGAPRRRRRRRGGRRRRRGGGADIDGARDESKEQSDDDKSERPGRDRRQGDQSRASGDSSTDDSDENTRSSDQDSSADDSGNDDGGNEDGSQRRRRRRRRRRGEDSAPSADDPAEVVVRVREPRSRRQAAQEVTGIEGSTRMEAKRQRRREGREAGRRRAPILSEAEFLARRESVVRKMIIRQREELSQIAVLEDDILVEHYVDRESAASLIGNVYLGRVQNVLPSMEAAFIDIGRGRNAVLYAGEVDWDAFGAGGQQRKVENVLKSGQAVLVQVTKDPVGAKGARLTSHITLPGRYIVYAPGGHLSGISRKLPDNERKRLKSVLSDLVPDSASVIVRTAAEGASEDELVRDVNRLKAQWEDIERKSKQGSAPKLLYGEPDLTVRIVRDLFTEDFAELIIQGNGSQADAYDSVDAYVGHVAPHLHDRLRRWDGDADGDLFAKFRLDEQIAKALERKVFLPSGGSLIIDRTEAMTVIDVNTGKFTGSGGNLEATVTSNNLEAAEEIVRQLRLRDIGGIIVIDFIDMVLPSNRELLLRRLVECLGRDRTRHQVAEVTSLGLVQMTRKKIGTGLLEAFTSECEHCHGRGYEIYDMPVETQKQPDGGSRDHRGGGRGGRGRGNQSGSGSSGNGKHHPVPAPPAHRPDPVPQPATSSEETAPTPADPAPESSPGSSPEPRPEPEPTTVPEPASDPVAESPSEPEAAPAG